MYNYIDEKKNFFFYNFFYQPQCKKNLIYIKNKILDYKVFLKNISFFLPENIKILYLPSFDNNDHFTSPSKLVIAQRIYSIVNILNQKEARIFLLTDIEAWYWNIPKVNQDILNIELSSSYSLDDLAHSLTLLGYQREQMAVNLGEFAIRGNILDIVYICNNFPVATRIEFNYNEVLSIKEYSVFDQLNKKNTEQLEVNIYSIEEINFDKISVSSFKQSLDQALSKNNNLDFSAEVDDINSSLDNNKKFNGIENYSPILFSNNVKIIADILPDNSEIYADAEFDPLNDHIKKIEHSLCSSNITSVLAKAHADSVKKVNIQFINNIISDYNFKPLVIHGRKNSSANKVSQLINSYQDEIKIIACRSLTVAKNLSSFLTKESISSKIIYSLQEAKSKDIIYFINITIFMNYKFLDYVFFSERSIFSIPQRVPRANTARTDSKKFLQELDCFHKGNYVVHKEYGVGIYLGLTKIAIQKNYEKDFILIEYKDKDKLYIPVEDSNLVSKYHKEENVTLDSLKRSSWQKKKNAVKKDLLAEAEKIINIAALRNSIEAPMFLDLDQTAFDLLISHFIYPETDDQLKAIYSIEQDLQSGKLMDRLLCGDVGFGKTEVALRATGLVTLDLKNKKQVAIVAPTTLLCTQLYNIFKDRYKDLPVNIDFITSNLTTKEANRIKQELSENKIDIIVGTHSLFSDKVNFKSLGLLIIDEEHLFGVKAKESIKKKNKNVHILSLSATPIPRTLEMSLVGIKTMSLLSTPPMGRLPIKTYSKVFNLYHIKEMINFEIQRGGSVFFIFSRIAHDIESIYNDLKIIMPEVKFVTVHGKMTPKNIEKNILAFKNREYQVMLTTNIISSGLDMTFVNTLIIYKANMFGMAQLYQLRGRVGRSNEQAYFYMTYTENCDLSDNAMRRLDLISSLEAVGSNFMLASHDMELRGEGNILGDSQSGHIKEIGTELYYEMFAEATMFLELKQDSEKEIVIPDNFDFSPAVECKFTEYHIPSSYISDDEIRVSLYKRFSSNIKSHEDIDLSIQELEERFGAAPDEIRNLLRIIYIKFLCKNLYISDLKVTKDLMKIKFLDNNFTNPEFFIDLLQQGKIKLTADHNILIDIPNSTKKKDTKIFMFIEDWLNRFPKSSTDIITQ